MRRWIALGVTVVGVAWGPYLYTELSPRVGGIASDESQLMAATDVVPAHALEPAIAAERVVEPSAAPEARVAPTPMPSPPAAEPYVTPSAPEPPPTALTPPAAPPSALAAPPSAPEPESERGAAALAAAEPTRPEAEPARPAPASPEERARAFHGVFEGEPRDGAWADEQEPGIRQLTAAVGIPAEDLVDVACRHTVCKLTFKAPQLAEGVEGALQARIKAEFGDILLETHDPQSERPAQLYVLRSGYPLEAPRPN